MRFAHCHSVATLHKVRAAGTVDRGSILIVDDEQLIRWSLKQRLERAGYETCEAASRQQTLENLHDRVVLVLLDLKLPDASGLELLHEIHAKRPGCRIIMMTAHRTPEIVAEALRNGACDVLQKPFELDEIAKTIEATLA